MAYHHTTEDTYAVLNVSNSDVCVWKDQRVIKGSWKYVLVCEDCELLETTLTDEDLCIFLSLSRSTMARHLSTHGKFGHKVPFRTYTRLGDEIADYGDNLNLSE